MRYRGREHVVQAGDDAVRIGEVGGAKNMMAGTASAADDRERPRQDCAGSARRMTHMETSSEVVRCLLGLGPWVQVGLGHPTLISV